MKITIILTTYVIAGFCQTTNKIFEDVNENYLKFNAIAAELTWESFMDPTNPYLGDRSANYQKRVIAWQQTTCKQLAVLERRQLLNATQTRQTYILCRGPKFTYEEARRMSTLYNRLQSIYSEIQLCFPNNVSIKANPITTEAAIFNHLSNLKEFFKLSDETSFAAKMAANNDLAENGTICLNGESDFEKMMEYSRNERVLKFLWLFWREKMVPMREPYKYLVNIENRAAKRNGYQNIGEAWRDELEVPNLIQTCRRLYAGVRPLYVMLHGVVRFYLRRVYGEEVSERGPLPAHLLGNLWSQDWGPLIDLISPNSLNLDESIKKHNWTVYHMVKCAEDFYQSMGLPPMTDAFWRQSVFENRNGVTRCHGTAADMFKNGDYRLLYCSGKTMDDFYVLHHELGHIQYYMSYSKQPGLFRQANAAFQESIGDAIMYGVMTPQHLYRLGLVNDTIVYVDNAKENTEDNYGRIVPVKGNSVQKDVTGKITVFDNENYLDERLDVEQINSHRAQSNRFDNKDISNIEILFDDIQNDNLRAETESDEDKDNDKGPEDLSTDEIILFKQALTKIPQIPFALLIDEYRWKYFHGRLDPNNDNKEFWDMTLELQGISPPEERGNGYFDIGAKFHVPDNTPYVRYFLSSFLQHQIFESLCRAAVFGNRNNKAQIPDTISLNRCDIYGSKAAGKLLKDFMSRGDSQHWSEILQSTTGTTDITASALQRYYRPLYGVLERIVKKHKIPLGW